MFRTDFEFYNRFRFFTTWRKYFPLFNLIMLFYSKKNGVTDRDEANQRKSLSSLISNDSKLLKSSRKHNISKSYVLTKIKLFEEIKNKYNCYLITIM